MGSAIALSILGCTPTRPVSDAAPEVAKSQNSSAASSSASSVVPAAPVAQSKQEPKQAEPEQKIATATNPPAKTNPSTRIKAAAPNSTVTTGSANAKPAAKVAAPAAPVAKPSVASAPEKKPAASTLDLKALEQNLRDTPAIGVFTKLSLKNQVDDLLNDFRDFYRGKIKVQLSELRQRYDLLLMKVLSLLQDSDARLASDIVSSREAIWDILKDPKKFAQI